MLGELLISMAEQVPESLVVAYSFVSSFVDYGLALFLFSVQFAAMLQSSLENFEQKPPKLVYTVMTLVISFALGT